MCDSTLSVALTETGVLPVSSKASTYVSLLGDATTNNYQIQIEAVGGVSAPHLGSVSFTLVATDAVTSLPSAPYAFDVDIKLDCNTSNNIIGNGDATISMTYTVGAAAETETFNLVYGNDIAVSVLSTFTNYCGGLTYKIVD